MMETPVPVPNTEVKHHSGEDSTAVRKEHAAGPSSFFILYLFYFRPESILAFLFTGYIS